MTEAGNTVVGRSQSSPEKRKMTNLETKRCIFCDKMIGKYIHRLKYSNFQQCLATMLLISKFPVFNYLLHVKGLDN